MLSAGDCDNILALIGDAALWIEPSVRVTDCRDAKDNKYLELAYPRVRRSWFPATTICSC